MAYARRTNRENFLTDMGKNVMPASIPEIDMTILDEAIEAEQEFYQGKLDNVLKNIETYGKIEDELVGIEGVGEMHREKIENLKKKYNVDEELFLDAANNIDKDPVSLYSLNRNVSRMINDPMIAEIEKEKEIVNKFKEDIYKIDDPNMQLMASEHLKNVLDNTDKNNGNLSIRSLSIEEYVPVDIVSGYSKVLESTVSPKVTSKQVTLPDGSTAIQDVETYDPKMIEMVRKEFISNPSVRNNLISKGIMDKDGNITDPTIFNTIERNFTTSDEKYKYYNRPRKGDKTSDPSNPYADMTEGQKNVLKEAYSSYFEVDQAGNVTDIKASEKPYFETPYAMDEGGGIDYNTVSLNEGTMNREKTLVHKDPGNDAINLGSFSFNSAKRGMAMPFLSYLMGEAYSEDEGVATRVQSVREALGKNDLEAAKRSYEALQAYIGLNGNKGGLKADEKEYANREFMKSANKVLEDNDLIYAELTNGQKTYLFDTWIQHGGSNLKKMMKDYDNGNLEVYLAEQRSRRWPEYKSRYQKTLLRSFFIDQYSEANKNNAQKTAANTGVKSPVEGGEKTEVNQDSIDGVWDGEYGLSGNSK